MYYSRRSIFYKLLFLLKKLAVAGAGGFEPPDGGTKIRERWRNSAIPAPLVATLSRLPYQRRSANRQLAALVLRYWKQWPYVSSVIAMVE